jgi:hypothetical protein
MSQGFVTASYDMVVAACNVVLHATQDLEVTLCKLLQPGVKLLLLLEMTEP